MRKNYNPYTVPDGFFEEIGQNAINSYRKKTKAMKYAILSAALAVALVFIPVFEKNKMKVNECDVNGSEAFCNLAEMYDYDIFLQVNF